ncbi:MAG: hypothetical protein JWQ79_2030 [Mucilaginibacter sp.]|jgi:hypothetical protein|nr:hypothetical protein [Mucilaginibacter sp.]
MIKATERSIYHLPNDNVSKSEGEAAFSSNGHLDLLLY